MGTNNSQEKTEKEWNLLFKSIYDEYFKKFITDRTISLFSLEKPEIKNILEKLSLGIVGKNNLG